MSQEFAIRNKILVEVSADKILIGTAQPFMTDWVHNLERSLSPKKLKKWF
jgi:general secretion pathway protein E